MKAILNIGLNQSKNFTENPQKNSVLRVLEVLKMVGIDWQSVNTKQSNTEETAIVVIEKIGMDFKQKIHLAANVLQQDCIAVYYPHDNAGELIGEWADTWGTFDKSEFVF